MIFGSKLYNMMPYFYIHLKQYLYMANRYRNSYLNSLNNLVYSQIITTQKQMIVKQIYRIEQKQLKNMLGTTKIEVLKILIILRNKTQIKIYQNLVYGLINDCILNKQQQHKKKNNQRWDAVAAKMNKQVDQRKQITQFQKAGTQAKQTRDMDQLKDIVEVTEDIIMEDTEVGQLITIITIMMTGRMITTITIKMIKIVTKTVAKGIKITERTAIMETTNVMMMGIKDTTIITMGTIMKATTAVMIMEGMTMEDMTMEEDTIMERPLVGVVEHLHAEEGVLPHVVEEEVQPVVGEVVVIESKYQLITFVQNIYLRVYNLYQPILTQLSTIILLQMSQQEKNCYSQQDRIDENNQINIRGNQRKQSIPEDKHESKEEDIFQKSVVSNNEINLEDIPLNSLICFLCQEPIISVVQVICGHSFCEYCLSEYLLVSMDCPICGHKIREKKGAANKRLDQIIQQFTQFLGNQAIHQLNERKKQRHKIKQQKKVQNIATGIQVDIRNDDFIWKKGRIVRTLNRICEHTRVKYMIVQYTDTQKRQQFPPNSSRIAKAGYYTNRNDIPKFNYWNQQEQKLNQRKRVKYPDDSQEQQALQKNDNSENK